MPPLQRKDAGGHPAHGRALAGEGPQVVRCCARVVPNALDDHLRAVQLVDGVARLVVFDEAAHGAPFGEPAGQTYARDDQA